jgi:phosphoglycolate phosphatase-like HAD superfamily hydrolase
VDTTTVTAPGRAGTRAVAVFDVDGTLADARHRLHWITGKPTHAEWVGFFDAAENDPPVPEGVALARHLAAHLDIAYLTARPERIHELTARWLTAQRLPEGSLRMKAADDRRPAREMKLAAIR